MIALLLLAAGGLAGRADAATFDVTELALGGVPVDVTVSGGVVYVAEQAGWEWSDGTVVVAAASADEAPDVLATAVATGAGALYLCNDQGLWAWAGGPAVLLAPQGCTGLTTSADSVLFNAGTLHSWDGADTDLGLVAGLYAALPGAVAWANAGDTSLSVDDGFGVSSIAAGGLLTALSAGPASDWALGTEGPAALRETGASYHLLAFTPQQVGVGEFDGDGSPDLWAFGDGYLYWWTAAGDEAVTGVPSDRVVAADIDADGCTDVVGVSAAGTLQVARVVDCPAGDADGDGFPDPADCDDVDPGVHPGAFELCDGVDQDCDGDVDEPGGLIVPTDAAAVEGVQFTLTAQPDGCEPEVATSVAWSFAGDAACSATDASAICVALDNTTVSATATATFESGATATRTLDVDVANVAPTLDLEATDWGNHDEGRSGSVVLDPGEQLQVQLVADDVDADTVTFALGSATARGSSTVAPGGLWTLSLDDGASGEVVIQLADEDGGVSEFTFAVSSLGGEDTGTFDSFSDTGGFRSTDCADPSPGCGGGCCGVSGIVLAAVLRRLLG